MDGERFDRLTKHLADRFTRRRVLRGLLGVAAAAGAVRTRGPADAAPKNKACNVGCASLKGQQKNACMKACRDCGGDFNQVCVEDGPFGPVAFTCCPAGTFCVFGEGVCCADGEQPCFDPDGSPTCCPAGTFCDFETGACPALATCPSGEPAENCFAGVETSCDPDGFCALVTAGAGCACVERFCSGVPCATDADCAETGGVCATIPGCCPETTFCAVPCGSLGDGARAAGWG